MICSILDLIGPRLLVLPDLSGFVIIYRETSDDSRLRMVSDRQPVDVECGFRVCYKDLSVEELLQVRLSTVEHKGSVGY
jgi:hypothetical protein